MLEDGFSPRDHKPFRMKCVSRSSSPDGLWSLASVQVRHVLLSSTTLRYPCLDFGSEPQASFPAALFDDGFGHVWITPLIGGDAVSVLQSEELSHLNRVHQVFCSDPWRHLGHSTIELVSDSIAL